MVKKTKNKTKSRTSSSVTVSIREMELADTQALFVIENSPVVWRYTHGANAPYTRAEIEEFITASRPIEQSGQVRFMINLNSTVIGTADLYDYNATDRSAWVALLIYPFELHGKGYGGAALMQLMNRANQLGLKSLKAEVELNNQASIALFTKCGFAQSSQKGRYINMDKKIAPEP